MAEIRLFTTPTCAYCQKVKDWFSQQNCPYTELDITRDVEALREWRALSGGVGVPVVSHGKDLVIGFDPDRLARLKACSEQTGIVDPADLPE